MSQPLLMVALITALSWMLVSSIHIIALKKAEKKKTTTPPLINQNSFSSLPEDYFQELKRKRLWSRETDTEVLRMWPLILATTLLVMG